ncbi:MAG: rod shape-determining protein MreD [Tannerellaceae bacterium]|jgi:rod shape-determining protein MreD|nr:rod shape-determining protein MreD [Tannerellaceae bacterium]
MVNSLLLPIFIFILCIAAQELVFNQLYILRLVTPFFYLYFLLKLPSGLAHNYILLLSFFLGLIVDAFGNTPGMHAAACTVAGFTRPYIISLFHEKGLPEGTIPSYRSLGHAGFVQYVFSLVAIHHTTLAIVESFAFFDIYFLFLRIVANTLLTATLLCIIELFGFNKESYSS